MKIDKAGHKGANYHLIINSAAVPGMREVYRWTFTGIDQNQVERESNRLMLECRSASFVFPGKIDNPNDSHHGWYRTTGFTSDNEEIDAHEIHQRELPIK